jgi:hypothetical protein
MEKHCAAGVLSLMVLGCASVPPQGAAASAQERYAAATRYCENEYHKQWKEYLTGLEFASPEYAACLARAKSDYGRALQPPGGS